MLTARSHRARLNRPLVTGELPTAGCGSPPSPTSCLLYKRLQPDVTEVQTWESFNYAARGPRILSVARGCVPNNPEATVFEADIVSLSLRLQAMVSLPGEWSLLLILDSHLGLLDLNDTG